MATRKKKTTKKAPAKRRAPVRRTKATKKVARKKAPTKRRAPARKKDTSRTKKTLAVTAKELLGRLPSFDRPSLPPPARALPPLSAPVKGDPSHKQGKAAPPRFTPSSGNKPAPFTSAPPAPKPIALSRASGGSKSAWAFGASGWAFLGLGAALWFISRRAEAAPPLPQFPVPEGPGPAPPITLDPEPEPEPVPSTPPPTSIQTGGPDGYRRLKAAEVSAPVTVPSPVDGSPVSLATFAAQSLRFPMGHQELVQGSDGKLYAAVLEEHFHEPGGPLKPWGKHKGVSLFIKA